MIHFEKRLNPSRRTTVITPIIAVILTMIAGGIMFAALGKPPLEAIRIIFWDPLFDPNFASYSRLEYRLDLRQAFGTLAQKVSI
jgi:ABC-type uncharacterized transport system permease subunit